MTPRPDSAANGRLRDVVEPVVTEAGCDLEGLEVAPAGRRRLVRVVVDRDGGVSLDTVAEVSTALGAVLDDSDALGGSPYVLEVTSPGVDRPLTAPRHWRRAAGRLVRVSLRAGGALEGRVLEADEDGVVLELPDGSRRLPLAELGPGAVRVEFRRAAAENATDDAAEDAADDPDADELDDDDRTAVELDDDDPTDDWAEDEMGGRT